MGDSGAQKGQALARTLDTYCAVILACIARSKCRFRNGLEFGADPLCGFSRARRSSARLTAVHFGRPSTEEISFPQGKVKRTNYEYAFRVQ